MKGSHDYGISCLESELLKADAYRDMVMLHDLLEKIQVPPLF